MKILLIYNPKANHGQAKKILPRAQAFFEQKKIETVVKLTQYPQHAIELVQSADFSKYHGVVAAGGDGTLFEVINGYFQNKSKKRIPIGVLPLGTGNSFAKDLQLESGEWAKAIEMINRNRHGKVDVVHFNANGEEYYYLNILGLGFVTDVMHTSMKIKFLGNLCYTLAVLYQTLFLKSYPLTMVLDGEALEREMAMMEISNTRYTARNFLMAPQAKFDDGYLDVILAKKLSRIRLLRLFPKLFKGEHIHAPEVEIFKAKHIEIHSPKPLTLGPDGELLGSTPLKIQCLHKAVAVFLP